MYATPAAAKLCHVKMHRAPFSPHPYCAPHLIGDASRQPWQISFKMRLEEESENLVCSLRKFLVGEGRYLLLWPRSVHVQTQRSKTCWDGMVGNRANIAMYRSMQTLVLAHHQGNANAGTLSTIYRDKRLRSRNPPWQRISDNRCATSKLSDFAVCKQPVAVTALSQQDCCKSCTHLYDSCGHR